jgi:hypothetical protein
VKPPLVERPREKRGQTPIRSALRLSIVVWIVYAVTAGGSLATADAVAMLEQAKSIVDRGALDIPAVWSLEEWRGRDGRYYSPFGIAQSVYDIPWLLAGRSIPKVIGRRLPDPDALAKALVAFGNSFVTAAAVGFAFLLAVSISNDRRASVAAALVLAFGTLLWPYSKYGFNAPLVTLGLTVGAYGFVAGTMTASVPTLLLGGVGFGLALLTRHEMILASVVGIVWLMTEARRQRLDRRHVAAASVAIAAALIIWAVLNVVRFGNPFRTGHHPSFSFGGFLGFSISPWGALLLYSPIAAAGLVITWRNRRYGWCRLLLALAAVLGIFYASLDDWLGTRSYGPRYLVPLLPLMMAPLAVWCGTARSRAATMVVGGLCAVSVLVQLPPVLVEISHSRIASGKPARPGHLLDWDSSPLVVTSRSAIAAVPANVAYLSGTASPPTMRASNAPLSEHIGFSLDFWWLYVVYLGAVPLRVALFTVTVMVAAAAWLARRLWIDLPR